MYHNFCRAGDSESDHVSLAAARVQLAYLRRHFHVVPLSRLVDQIKSGLPFEKPTVALTIDDGRRNSYEVFFPLLKEFQMPATLFIVSSFIQREDWIWTDKVLWLSEHTTAPEELHSGRIEHFFRILNRLRPERRDACIESMAEFMSVSIPKNPPAKYAPCSWSELREMADSGLVEIGSHTVTHPILATLTDEEAWWELMTSRSQIQEGIGRAVECFCFPNGKPEDYRPGQIRQVRQAGYTCAVVTNFGMTGSEADPYELPRIGIGGRSDFLSFAKYVDGVEQYQDKLSALLRARWR